MSPLSVTSLPSLVVGCGYLGLRVARRWLAAGRRVAALTRRNAERFSRLGLTPYVGDVLDLASLRGLPEAATLLYSVGLDRSSGQPMREVYVDGLGNVLTSLPSVSRLIYISSTSVYGQTDGELVDESSPAEPIEESGRVVLEAEQLLRSQRPDAIILRFGGIYGPDRLLRRQAQLHSPEGMTGDPQRWLNLVHVDDGVDAILTAEVRGLPGAIYNIVDDESVTRLAYYTRLAQLIGGSSAAIRRSAGLADRSSPDQQR